MPGLARIQTYGGAMAVGLALGSFWPGGGDVWSVAFAPGKKILASGDGDWNRPGELKLWDTETWSEKPSLKHTGEVLCLAFSPGAKALAAGSWDRTILIWRLGEDP